MRMLHVFALVGQVWLVLSLLCGLAWIVAHLLHPADDDRDDDQEYLDTFPPDPVASDYPTIERVSRHGWILHHGNGRTR